MSSRSLQGYTTIDKSLTGIITISDGGGTTISQGNIVCDTITANSTNFPSYYPEYFTATDNNRTDSGLYRILFTGDSNDQPHPFILNATFRYRPSTQELFCVASNIYVQNDSSGMTDFYPLLFAERNTSNGSRSVKQSLDFLYYQPSTQKLFVNNMDFTGNLNGVSTSFFSDIPKISLLYDGLGGNNSLGPTLPTWSDTYKEISFPTNVWILGTLTTALPAVFTNQSNLFNYPVHEGDANFNTRGYLQISIESDGTTTSAGIAGIDFGSWNGRANASSRIYARDNANSSSDLYLVTAPSGSITSVPVPRMVIKADGFIGINTTTPSHTLEVSGDIRCTNFYPDKIRSQTNGNIIFETYPSGTLTERMRINSNGNVGIGTAAVPSYRLDVNGQGRFMTGVLTNTLISTSATTLSSIFSDKTTGNITLGSATTTASIGIGNGALNTNIVNLYGNTNVIKTIPVGDNSTRIASTEWVNANTVTQTMGITQSNYNNLNLISNSTDTTGFSFSNICMSEDGETGYIFNGTRIYKTSDSGSNWVYCHTASIAISCICCSNTGQYVYYSRTTTNPPLYSSDFGQTFSSITGLTPQNSPHKIFCSYDGSIVCLTFPVTISGRITPYYNTSYGTTSTWNVCSNIPVLNASSINDLVLDGQAGTLNSMTVAAGKTGNNDYVYYSSSPTTNSWVQKLSQSIWSSLSFKQNGILLVGHAAGVAGIHRSLDSGVTYSVIPSTIGYTINCVDASRDGTQIFFGHSTGFYYSSDSGNTITNFSTTVPNFLQTSQSGKTTMVVPATITDTIYTFFTNPKLTFKTDIHWPKNRVILQSNLITNYNDNQEVYYPYRTQFLAVDTSNNFDLYWPLYSSYVIRPSGNATCYLPEVTERHVGLQITIVKMSAHALNFVCAGTNLLWNYGVHTGVTTLAGTGLGSNVTSVTLMASYGLTVSSPYSWVIISSP